MGSKEDTIPVRRSSGKVEELSAEELEQLNYERKVRDQESTGRLFTPKQVNAFAVIVCLLVLVYAIPRMFFSERVEESTYIPLSERSDELEYYDGYNSSQYRPPVQTTEPAPVPILPSELPEPSENPEPSSGPSSELADSNPEPVDQNTDRVSEPTPIKDDAFARLREQEKTLKRAEMESNIIDMVKNWSEDWSNQDVDGYLSHYAKKFISESGMDIAAWRNHRTSRVSRPEWIQVMLVDIEVNIISDYAAEVSFTQNYTASNYQDVSAKILSLEFDSADWKIVSETSPK